MANFKIPSLAEIKSGDQTFNGYIALPKEIEYEGAPSVIVIQEIFGVNKGIRDKCEWLADQGFIACAPDLFHQFEPGIELSDQNPEDLERAFDLFSKFDITQGVNDIRTTKRSLKTYPDGNNKVGAIGYCLGGKLAYLTACHTDIDATVGYYGVGIEEQLVEAKQIISPLMLHIAEEDGFVPPEAQKAIKDGLADNEHVTIHSYPGVDHAFAREGGDNYDENAANLANDRTIEFLKTHLK